MLRDVVFDCFGTLVEYRPDKVVDPDERRAHDLVLAHGGRLSFEEFRTGLYAAFERHELEARRTLREPHIDEISRDFLAGAAGLAGDAAAALAPEFSRVFLEEWSSGVSPVEGLAEVLEALAPRHRLSVLSNSFSPRLVHDTLARAGVAHRFAAVYVSADLGIRKPHRGIFEAALSALGGRAGEALYVGDSYGPDYLGATGAGLRAVLIDPGERHPVPPGDRIRSLAELPEVLGPMGEPI
jgi:putative hydrolase of the HAD superfamily